MEPTTHISPTPPCFSTGPKNPYLRIRSLLIKQGMIDQLSVLEKIPLLELSLPEKELLVNHYRSSFIFKERSLSIQALYDKLIENCGPHEIFHCGSGPFKMIARTYFPRIIESAYYHIHRRELVWTPDLREALEGVCRLYCVKTDDDFRNTYDKKVDRPALKAHNVYCAFLASLLGTTPLDIQKTAFSKLHHPGKDDLNRFGLHTIGRIDIIDVIEIKRATILKKGAGKINVKPLLIGNLKASIRPGSYHKNPWVFLFEIITGTITHGEMEKTDSSKRIYEFRDLLKFSSEMVKGLTPRYPETPRILSQVLFQSELLNFSNEARKFFDDHLPDDPDCAAAFVLQCASLMMEDPVCNADWIDSLRERFKPLWQRSRACRYLAYATLKSLPTLCAFLAVKGLAESGDLVESGGNRMVQVRVGDHMYSHVTILMDIKRSVAILKQNPHIFELLCEDFATRPELLRLSAALAKEKGRDIASSISDLLFLATSRPLEMQDLAEVTRSFQQGPHYGLFLNVLASRYSDGLFAPKSPTDMAMLSSISKVIGLLIQRGQIDQAVALYREAVLNSPMKIAQKLSILKQMARSGVAAPPDLSRDLYSLNKSEGDIRLFFKCLKTIYPPQQMLDLLKPLIEADRYAPSREMADCVVDYCEKYCDLDDRLLSFWLFCLKNTLWSVVDRSHACYTSLIGQMFRFCYQNAGAHHELLKHLKDELEVKKANAEVKKIAPLQIKTLAERPELIKDPLHTFCIPKKHQKLLAIKHHFSLGEWSDALALASHLKHIDAKLINHFEFLVKQNPSKAAFLCDHRDFFKVYEKAQTSPFPVLQTIFCFLTRQGDIKSAKRFLSSISKHLDVDHMNSDFAVHLITVLKDCDSSDCNLSLPQSQIDAIIRRLKAASTTFLDQLAPLARLGLLSKVSDSLAKSISTLCVQQAASSPLLVESLIQDLPHSATKQDRLEIAQILFRHYLNRNPTKALAWFEKTRADQSALCDLVTEGASRKLPCPASFYHRCLTLACDSRVIANIIASFTGSYSPVNFVNELRLLSDLFLIANDTSPLVPVFCRLMSAIIEQPLHLDEVDRQRILGVAATLKNERLWVFAHPPKPKQKGTRKLVGCEFSVEQDALIVAYIADLLPSAPPVQASDLIESLLSLPPSKLTMAALRSVLTDAQLRLFQSPLHIAHLADDQFSSYQGPRNFDSIAIAASCAKLYLKVCDAHSVRRACSLLGIIFAFSRSKKGVPSPVKRSEMATLYKQWLKIASSSELDMTEFERGTLLIYLTRKLAVLNHDDAPLIVEALQALQKFCPKNSADVQLSMTADLLRLISAKKKSRGDGLRQHVIFEAVSGGLEDPNCPQTSFEGITHYPVIVDFLRHDRKVLSLFMLRVLYTSDVAILKNAAELIRRVFGKRSNALRKDWEHAYSLQRACLSNDSRALDKEMKFFIRQYVREKSFTQKSIFEIGVMARITDYLLEKKDLEAFSEYAHHIAGEKHPSYQNQSERIFCLIRKMTDSPHIRNLIAVPKYHFLMALMTELFYRNLTSESVLTEQLGEIAVNLAIMTLVSGDLNSMKLFRFSRFRLALEPLGEKSPSYRQMMYLQMFFELPMSTVPNKPDDNFFALIMKLMQYPAEYGLSCGLVLFHFYAKGLKKHDRGLYKEKCRELYECRHFNPSLSDIEEMEKLLGAVFQVHHEFIPHLFNLRFVDCSDEFYDIFLDHQKPAVAFQLIYGTLISTFRPGHDSSDVFFKHLKRFGKIDGHPQSHTLMRKLQKVACAFLSGQTRLDADTVDALVFFLKRFVLADPEGAASDQSIEEIMKTLLLKENFPEFEQKFAFIMCYLWSSRQLKEMKVSFTMPDEQEKLLVMLSESSSLTSSFTLLKIVALTTDYMVTYHNSGFDKLLSRIIPLLSQEHQKYPPLKPDNLQYWTDFGNHLADLFEEPQVAYRSQNSFNILETVFYMIGKEVALTGGYSHFFVNFGWYYAFIVNAFIIHLTPKGYDEFFGSIQFVLKIFFAQQSFLLLERASSEKTAIVETLLLSLFQTLFDPAKHGQPNQQYYECLYQCVIDTLIASEDDILGVSHNSFLDNCLRTIQDLIPDPFKSEGYETLVRLIKSLGKVPNGPKIPFSVKIKGL